LIIIYGAVVDEWGNKNIEEIMTKKHMVIEDDESIGAVLSLFRREGISHAPVVKEGKLVGIISIHDIIQNIFIPKQKQSRGEIVGEKVPILSIPVKGIMSKPAITVLRKKKLKDAVEKMHKFNISSLIVIEKNKPIGLVTKRDFLEPIAQMEKKGLGLAVQFSVKDVGVDNIQRDFIMKDFESFANRYNETLESGILFVYIKGHGTNMKGDQLVHCRLQLRTVKASFFSSSEGYGVEQNFQVALDRLENQILKSTDVQYDPEVARNYLRRIHS
jgi:CBS domain-containing protein